jgi:hypothetical protein
VERLAVVVISMMIGEIRGLLVLVEIENQPRISLRPRIIRPKSNFRAGLSPGRSTLISQEWAEGGEHNDFFFIFLTPYF